MQFEELTLEDKVKVVKGIFKSYYDGNIFLKPISYTNFYNNPDANKLVYRFYATTNENLNYYLKLASFNNKDVLVPTASGDHALNAIYLGAKSVETFDINSIAKYHSNLKACAIQHLTREEFLKFYSYYNLLDENIYNKFKNHLPDETKYFFDEIFKFINVYGNKNIRSMTPLIEEIDLDMSDDMIFNNPYVKDEESYQKMQTQLKNIKTPIKHKVCPADELLENFDKKDIIIMSNIYSTYIHFAESKNQEIKPYIKEIPNLLKKNGTASLNYFYAGTPSEYREKYMIKMDMLPINYKLIEIQPKHCKFHRNDIIYAVDKKDFDRQK